MLAVGQGPSTPRFHDPDAARKFSVTPDDVVKLKQQGVTDKELAAMISKNANAGGGTTKSSETATDNSANLDLPTNMDVGLYYKKGGRWQEMLPEIVNWKTGGMMKSLISGGMVKGDVNGHLEGTNSRNSVTSPLEVVIDAPEGVAITEYQLLHLRVHEDAREFRTVTGGVFHVSGGAARDVVPFEGKKVSKGVYRVVVPN